MYFIFIDNLSPSRSYPGVSNAAHYIVATQDPELKTVLSMVPGVPLVSVSHRMIFLEPPVSQSSLDAKEVIS